MKNFVSFDEDLNVWLPTIQAHRDKRDFQIPFASEEDKEEILSVMANLKVMSGSHKKFIVTATIEKLRKLNIDKMNVPEPLQFQIEQINSGDYTIYYMGSPAFAEKYLGNGKVQVTYEEGTEQIWDWKLDDIICTLKKTKFK